MVRKLLPSKLGRNDPCHCGSGVKYKKCCLDKTASTNLNAWEFDSAFTKAKLDGKCLFVEPSTLLACGKPCIKSHTISKKFLKRISKDGNFYNFINTVQDLKKSGGELKEKLVGINKASTLSLFCDTHDSKIFAPIEQRELIPNSEQCFLLTYRTICMEYTKKIASVKHFENLLSQIPPTIQNWAQYHIMGSQVAIRDILEDKEKLELIYKEKNFNTLKSYVINIDKIPGFSCVGAHFPQYDFSGNHLQNLGNLDKKSNYLTYSLLPLEKSGVFILTWDDFPDNPVQKFIKSFSQLNAAETPGAIAKYLFSTCENMYINPIWWDSLSTCQKNVLKMSFLNAVHTFRPIQSDYLVAFNEVTFINWDINVIGYI